MLLSKRYQNHKRITINESGGSKPSVVLILSETAEIDSYKPFRK
jgi:hypothetical protein